MINNVGYHATSSKSACAISNKNFNIKIEPIHLTKKMPNDLGQGLYVFLENDFFPDHAKELAVKYVKAFKQVSNPHIVNIDLEYNENEVLDMDDEENIIAFNNYRYTIIESETFQKYKDQIEKSGAKTRGGYDGLILELLIDEQQLDVKFIKKRTFTNLGNSYKLSAYQNGLEGCIRQIDVINKKDVIEYGNQT